jgi:hypothetical protein
VCAGRAPRRPPDTVTLTAPTESVSGSCSEEGRVCVCGESTTPPTRHRDPHGTFGNRIEMVYGVLSSHLAQRVSVASAAVEVHVVAACLHVHAREHVQHRQRRRRITCNCKDHIEIPIEL